MSGCFSRAAACTLWRHGSTGGALHRHEEGQQRLLAAAGDDELLVEAAQELEMIGADDDCPTDKAWNAIHRCLTDGGWDSTTARIRSTRQCSAAGNCVEETTTSSATSPPTKSATSPQHSRTSTRRGFAVSRHREPRKALVQG